MKTKYDLIQMRDVWIDAYTNGDIDQLSFVESPHFFVKRGDIIITRHQQISHIKQHLSENTWRRFDLGFRDETIRITESKQWASISGTSSIRRDGMALIWFNFLEPWLACDDRWQIAALCYDEKNSEDDTAEDRSKPE
ncbi:hypothetical protein [Burkholderia sp. LMG 21824]|uniref:hypothetical protein n=1 Tax=Burkholderia sp. LMG 21824 TaxID=3158172 RepID=UPI003C2D0984